MSSKPDCFIAYPFEPDDLTDTIKNAIKRIKSNKMSVEIGEIISWESLRSSGKPIITEISQEIDKRDVFICELTELNPNVLFELGYAISKGKSIWIIRDDSKFKAKEEYEKVELIRTIKYSKCSNSKQIENEFYKRKPYEELGNHYYKKALDSGTENHEKTTLFFLKCNCETEASLTLTAILKDSKITLTIDDPKEIQTEDLLSWYTKEVHNSSAVIIHFVDSDRTNSKIHNAKCSLISGLAYGFKKSLLMLAHFPYDPPVDFSNILKIHKTAEQCEGFAKEFINSILSQYHAIRRDENKEKESSKVLSDELLHPENFDPNDFFTEKLVLILQGNAFPRTLPIDGIDKLHYLNRQVTPIVPFKSLILRYLKPEEIADRMRFEQIETDEIAAHLNLSQSVIDGKAEGEDFIISKTYSFKNGDINVQMAVPILEIWPDFVYPNWKIYFSYFSSTDKEKVFYASPFIKSDEELGKTEFKNKANKTVREIIRLDHFPEVYECRTYWEAKGKRLVYGEAGILLLAKPQQIWPVGKTFDIGVNVGTTRTYVCIREGTSLPEPIAFNEHFFRITAAPTLERVELYDYFLPPLKEEMPFWSIFHDFLIKSNDIQPILDGHIYFPYDPKEFNAGDAKKKMDLKWGKPEDRERLRTFLEQLCLMCSVEVAWKGAEKISWRFAIPIAFSQSDELALKINWKIISEKTFKLTGLKAGDKNLFYTMESVAFANYFTHSRDVIAAMPRGVVFIDIGRTTSDISIWCGYYQLLVSTSLGFAGQYMFSNPLWQITRKTKKKENYFLMAFFKDEDIDALYREEVKNNPIAFYAQLDFIVSAENKYQVERLPSLSNDEKTKEFKQILAIGISGLLYYIGLVIQNIPDRQKYIESAPNIYWGGNGSRLLNWLAGGHFSPDSAINRLLKAIFRKASGISPEINFEINVSPKPKAEVAYGLVCDMPPLAYDEYMIREGYFLAGEAFTDFDNKQYEWNEKLTATKISKGIKLLYENCKYKMERLEDFIKTFNENADLATISRIQEIPRILKDTGAHVNYECAKLRNTKEEEIHVEPLFITALKKFLDEKINEWR